MNLDILIFQQINNLAGRSELLDATGIFFAEYCQYIFTLALIFIFRKNIKAIIWAVLAGVLAKFGIAELIRSFWDRSRPFVENNVNLLFDKDPEPSFPSGHASLFFALSTVVYFYNKKAGVILYAASFLISLARVFSGVHWPSDILAGAVIGVLSGLVIVKISRRFK
jgi:undecaprenyl-diphosphatase